MKLKFKSLQGSSFSVDAEPSDTIASVKSKIQSEHGHQATSQKIIYSGKILTDADTVKSCGVSEKDFLVLMVSKPKVPKAVPVEAPALAAATAPAATESSATIPAASSTTTTAAEPIAAPLASTTEAQSAPAAAAAPAPTTGPLGTSQFLTGPELEQAVNNIVDMGFEKSEVQSAMRASFNNPERAVEYLMTGIPAHLSQPPPPPPQQSTPQASQPAPQAGATVAPSTPADAAAAAPAPAPATAAAAPAAPRALNLFEQAAAQAQGGGAGTGAGAATGQGGAGAGALQGLQGMEGDGAGHSVVDLGNPAMLAQLRQLVQQNPAALAPLVQALAQQNPRLASAMAEDPEGVLNLLASGAAGGGEGEGEEGVTLPAMDELSPEDRTAVEQIIAMGIPENKAIEAYLMCGRNVEMAVQYYFENPQDFED